MGVVVRQADGHERAAVRAVVRLAWLDAYAGIFTRADIEGLFAERLAQSGSWVDDRDAYAGTLVADDAGQIVGMAGLAVRADGSGELTSLYVLPERQGQGIGRAL